VFQRTCKLTSCSCFVIPRVARVAMRTNPVKRIIALVQQSRRTRNAISQQYFDLSSYNVMLLSVVVQVG